jgi:hypothetical protein
MVTATSLSTSNARLLLLPVAAFLITLPLLMHGCSCGHDFDFHLQSWLDAANQMRHGTLLPRWAFTPAWNAGEPRFVFYPPLSWLLGALLTILFGLPAAPLIFTWLALTLGAFSMHHLAREVVSPNAALVVSALYIANPYMLFTAFERTAYGELLAAAWLPLLVLAALRTRPTIPGIALPIALLWLTNAPAAVIGCYTFAAVIAIRLALLFFSGDRREVLPVVEAAAPDSRPMLGEQLSSLPRSPYTSRAALELLLASTAGTVLGLALAAFYLLPAAYERRHVQIAMAVIANMRFQDNFLFGHTGNGPHDQVLHTASLIAVSVLATTAAALAATFALLHAHPKPVILSERNESKNLPPSQAPHYAEPISTSRRRMLIPAPLLVATSLSLLIAFLLTPISTPLWNHLPELAFLQFPWRMLSMQGVILALATGLFLSRIRLPYLAAVGSAVLLASTLAGIASHLYRQGCELLDRPEARAALFVTHHGVDSTDEYTPGDADNDVLRWDDPAYWLANSPAAFAPNTIPNPAATIVNYDAPHPVEQNVSGQAPAHLTLHLDHPQFLIYNLRDYPNWHVIRSVPGDPHIMPVEILTHFKRDDGLLAIAMPAGDYNIDLLWIRSRDQTLGLILSFLGAITLIALSLMAVRSRRLES